MSKAVYRSDLDFGTYEDDYRGFDMRDDEGSRGPLILALAIGVLLVFGAVVWNTYSQGVRTADGGLPVITADASSYKSVPDEPGGFEAPDLNKRIYDQLDGGERPITVASAPVNTVPAQLPPLGSDPVLTGGPPVELRPVSPATPAADETPRNPIVAEQAATLEALSGQNQPTAGTQVASLTPTRLPAPGYVAEVATSLPTAPLPMFAFNTSGDFMVQIAAFRSEDSANRAWNTATRTMPAIYAGAEKHVQRADLGARGIFYRLRVGSFSQRGDATSFCNALKAKQQQCIVVRQ